MKIVTNSVTRLADNYGMIQLIQDQNAPNQTVLLVDDEVHILNALARVLRKADCEVIKAHSGQQALEMINEHRPDLIISDVRMPEMDGIELLSKVNQQYPEIECILLTGYADLESTIKAINSGKISYYLEKPWDDTRLLDVVSRTLTIIDLKNHNENLQNTIREHNEKLKEVNHSLEQRVAERTAELDQSNQALASSNKTLRNNYQNMMELLSRLLTERLGESVEEMHAAADLSLGIAKSVGVEEADIPHLQIATKLRHLGKISLSDGALELAYLSKSPDAQKEYEQYPLMGHTLLMMHPEMQKAANIILQHKEKSDGSGFPCALHNQEISLEARILGVIDSYMDLIKGSYSGEKQTINAALAFLESEAKDELDTKLISALKYLVEHDPGLKKEFNISSGQLKVGMKLSRDLYTSRGLLLLLKNSYVDETIIQQLLDHEDKSKEKLEITVFEGH